MDILDLPDAFSIAPVPGHSPPDSPRVNTGSEYLSPELERALVDDQLVGEDQVAKASTFNWNDEPQQASEQSVDSIIKGSQPLALTRENLERLAMATNTKGPKTETTQSEIPAPGKSSRSKSISTTGVGFETQAFANGVLNPLKSAPFPVQDEDIQRRLDQARGSVSPPRSEYNVFVGRLDDAANETKIIEMYDKYVFQDSEGRHFQSGYRVQPDKMWTGFPPNVGFNNGLSAPKPDKVEGFKKNTFPPSIDAIRGTVLVKDDSDYITLPHMTLEFQAKEKNAHEAKVQSSYNGAAMVFSRNEALAYIEQPDPPGQSAVLSAAIIGPSWELYGHCAQPNQTTGRVEYHQHRIRGGSMERFDEYKQSRKVLRNMQDFAREQAMDLRDRMRIDFNEKEALRGTASSAAKSRGRAESNASRPPSAASNPPSGTWRKSATGPPSSGQNTPKSASSNGSGGSAT